MINIDLSFPVQVRPQATCNHNANKHQQKKERNTQLNIRQTVKHQSLLHQPTIRADFKS